MVDLVTAVAVVAIYGISACLAYLISKKAKKMSKDYVVNYLMEHPDVQEDVKKLFGWR